MQIKRISIILIYVVFITTLLSGINYKKMPAKDFILHIVNLEKSPDKQERKKLTKYIEKHASELVPILMNMVLNKELTIEYTGSWEWKYTVNRVKFIYYRAAPLLSEDQASDTALQLLTYAFEETPDYNDHSGLVTDFMSMKLLPFNEEITNTVFKILHNTMSKEPMRCMHYLKANLAGVLNGNYNPGWRQSNEAIQLIVDSLNALTEEQIKEMYSDHIAYYIVKIGRNLYNESIDPQITADLYWTVSRIVSKKNTNVVLEGFLKFKSYMPVILLPESGKRN